MYRKTNRLSTILNKRVEVWHNAKSDTKNRLGQYPIEEKLYTTMYACVVPQTGNLLNGRIADTTLARTTHKIVTRYRTDLSTDMWIMYGGERYDILYILNPYSNNERLELFCEVVL